MRDETQEQKLARLEFVNDQLVAELSNLDALLRSIGFTDGLYTVKAVALELLNEQTEEHQEFPS